MEATPLASLSLTHVHYVGTLLILFQEPPPSPQHKNFPDSAYTPPATEPPRPHILPLRLARPPPPGPLRHLRDPHLVLARGRDPPHVRRPNGLRGAQLAAQAVDKSRETETYVRPVHLPTKNWLSMSLTTRFTRAHTNDSFR